MPTLIALATADKDRLKTLESCRVPAGNPWQLSYLTTLGYLPSVPAPSTLEDLRLNPELKFETVVRYQHTEVIDAGLHDLFERLGSDVSFNPVHASWHALRRFPASTIHAALDGWLADPAAFARQRGPGIVVVYTPGSVADLCLLWNLRALHGWPAGLPLGIPRGGDSDATAVLINDLVTEPRLIGSPPVLTSASLPFELLSQIATKVGPRSATPDCVDPEDLLVPATPPARSSEIALAFNHGAATVSTRTDRDRAELKLLDQLGHLRPELRLSIRLVGSPLPPVRSLSAGYNGTFSAGARVLTANADGLRTFNWPSGMTTLRALASDRGVTATPSASGRSAMALLTALGSISDVGWLAHRPLLQLLYRKAGSSGMTWWKDRAREQAEAVARASADPESALAELTAAIERVSISHGGETAASLTFGELCGVLGGKTTAARWLAWAERRALLIRGTTVVCQHCRHKAWRTLLDIAPPLTCSGCGKQNDRPFAETALPFTYRLGESLRRCLENDSIHHLLTMRTLRDILDGAPDALVGLHPGIDFTCGGQQAEADVVVLLSSGALIPVEVKARSGGLRNKDLEQLDLLADWFDTPTVILATSDSDHELHPDFIAAGRTDAIPWRRLLTGEDLYARLASVTFGTRYPGPDHVQNAEAQPRKTTADEHDTDFVTWLQASGDLDAVSDPTAIGLADGASRST